MKVVLKSKYSQKLAKLAERGGDPIPDGRFEYFKKLITDHLNTLDSETMEKAGLPVGTVRIHKNGIKYIKLAPGKWRPKYDSHSRGAKMAIAAIKRKVNAAKTSKELMDIVMENRDRFIDSEGRPLPFVQELSKYVVSEQDRREKTDETPAFQTPAKVIGKPKILALPKKKQLAKEEKIAIVNDIVGRVETTRFTHEQGVKELMKKLGMSKESAEAVLDTYRYLPLPKDEPSGGSGDDKGGISQEQQEEAKKKLEELAVPMMEVEYTHAEYNKLFRRGEIKTPIKTVKMGVDQFSKLGSRDGGNRKSYIGAAYQTLTDPVVVIKEGNDDVYIKSFIGENGISTFISVEKDKEDGRFVVTNYKRKKDEILKKIKKADGIVYLKDDSGSPARMDKEGVPHASGSHTSTVSPESGEKSSDSGKKTKIIDKNGKLKPGIRMTGAEWQENGYFKYYHNGYSRDMIDDRYYTSDYRNELTETWEDFNARDKRTDGTESGSGEVSAKTGKLFNEVVKIAYGGKMPTFGEMDPTRRIYENADIGEITGLLVRGKFVALRPGLNDNVVYIDENEDERTTNYNLLDDASQKKLQGALKEHINKMLGLKKSIMAALEFFRNRMAKETEKSLTWSGHELQGRTKIHGMDISIENKKGSTRSGTDKDGHEWNVKMNFAYGYIRGAVGKDKDFLDCYIGPDPESDRVFIVHQNDPVTGSYDEDKVMLGFENKEAAEKAYLSQYDRPGFLGDIVEMGIEEFKDTIFDENNKGKRIEKALFTENELRNNARFAREVCKFFKDEEGNLNLHKTNRLAELPGFPEGLDLENCELLRIDPDKIYFTGGGDWQQMINFAVALKNGKLQITHKFENVGSQDAEQRKRMKAAIEEAGKV